MMRLRCKIRGKLMRQDCKCFSFFFFSSIDETKWESIVDFLWLEVDWKWIGYFFWRRRFIFEQHRKELCDLTIRPDQEVSSRKWNAIKEPTRGRAAALLCCIAIDLRDYVHVLEIVSFSPTPSSSTPDDNVPNPF